MGCCSCFGFISKPRSRSSQEDVDADGNGESTNLLHGGDDELHNRSKRSEEIIMLRLQSGKICREVPVKETHHLVRTEDENGNKMINEYVRVCKIGSGSYGKVVLYQSSVDGKRYAIKAFHKSHLLKLRVAPSETAMTDVLREVSIMKMLDHPNIVNLIEVIDDPNTDHFYMVLEYVEGKWVCECSGPRGGLGESAARKYLRDVVAGLMYLHDHNIVHGDIKPDNLLGTSTGTVKIGDFSVSQVFEVLIFCIVSHDTMTHLLSKAIDAKGELVHVPPDLAAMYAASRRKDDNDELRRSPGTPVFTAPECCLGLTYHGKAADTWAVGVTLYCLVLGQYPFLGETLQDTYDKIVKNPLLIPEGINPQLRNLLEGLLCKDPKRRLTLEAVTRHSWVIEDEGPIPQFLCRCRRESSRQEGFVGWGVNNDYMISTD